jgi:uncharacterized protein
MVASNVNNLPNRFFQPALSSDVAGHLSGLKSDKLGELVTDTQDVDQCIRVILTTPRGSAPHRPNFGSNLHLYLDYPINSARPHIVREAVNSLREWEPRIEIVKVDVALDGLAALACTVEWAFVAGVSDASFSTTLALGSIK